MAAIVPGITGRHEKSSHKIDSSYRKLLKNGRIKKTPPPLKIFSHISLARTRSHVYL